MTQLGPPDPDLPPRESGWSSPQVDAMVRLLGERGSVPAERFQNYYDDILHRRLIGSGRVTFLGGSEYHTDGTTHHVRSGVSGETTRVDVRRRVVDATYLAPTIGNQPPRPRLI